MLKPRDWIESSLTKAHSLLSCQTSAEVERITRPLTVTRFFGSIQVASYPDIAAKLEEIEELMNRSEVRDSENEEESASSSLRAI